MKKYRIDKRMSEINYKNREDIRPGCTCDDPEPEKVEEYETLEEAQEALKKYESSIYKFSSPIGTMYEVTEYAIQEIEYEDEDDEDSELYGDVYDFSEMKIRIVNEHYEDVAQFDNYCDAEQFINNDEEDRELKILF